MARTEGAAQTHAMLCEAIALAGRLAEMDDAEDWHRRQSGVGATDADRSLDAANAVCSLLLGQRECEMPLTHPDVLDSRAVAPADDGSAAAARRLAAHLGTGCAPCNAERGPGCEVGERLVAQIHRVGTAVHHERRGWAP